MNNIYFFDDGFGPGADAQTGQPPNSAAAVVYDNYNSASGTVPITQSPSTGNYGIDSRSGEGSRPRLHAVDSMVTQTRQPSTIDGTSTDKANRVINYGLSPNMAAATSPAVLGTSSSKKVAVSSGGVHVDRVNGIGMWRSWTRSFNTPLLALLDLFDNAVDASLTLLGQDASQTHTDGGVRETLSRSKKPQIHVNIDEFGHGGLVMRNSCLQEIPPMKQVLEVYKSSKGNASIGENGIGVKHACANLSKLSFVLTKTKTPTNHKISIGILMEELQKPEGCILPSHEFNINDDEETLHAQLEILATRTATETWGKALLQYGEGEIEVGIDRILQHVAHMQNHPVWKECQNVFTVVLTNLRHHARGYEDGTVNEAAMYVEEETYFDSRTQLPSRVEIGESGDFNRERTIELLKELRDELPRLYIHIHSMDVMVQNLPIDCLYWEKRLVELTSFEIKINPYDIWYSDPNVLKTVKAKQKQQKDHPPVRFFIGFDPHRCFEEKRKSTPQKLRKDGPRSDQLPSAAKKNKANSAVLLLIYSRESGRLIKEHIDPRSQLGLVAGSTDFKQGLTIILDDYNGTLPLNPTKQDMAFGFQNHGETHKSNVMEWTGALAHFYWSYHYERLGSSKGKLSESVKNAKLALEEMLAQLPKPTTGYQMYANPLPPLARATYTQFPSLEFRNAFGKLRTLKKHRENVSPVSGKDSTIRLQGKKGKNAKVATVPAVPTRTKQASRKVAGGKSTPAPFDGATTPSGRPKRAAADADLGYADTYDDDEEEDEELLAFDDEEAIETMPKKRKRNSSPHDSAAYRALEKSLKKKDEVVQQLFNADQKQKREIMALKNTTVKLQEQADNARAEAEKFKAALEKRRIKYHRLKAAYQKTIVKQEPEEASPNQKQSHHQIPSTQSEDAAATEQLRQALLAAQKEVSSLKMFAIQKDERIENLKKDNVSLEKEIRLLKEHAAITASNAAEMNGMNESVDANADVDADADAATTVSGDKEAASIENGTNPPLVVKNEI